MHSIPFQTPYKYKTHTLNIVHYQNSEQKKPRPKIHNSHWPKKIFSKIVCSVYQQTNLDMVVVFVASEHFMHLPLIHWRSERKIKHQTYSAVNNFSCLKMEGENKNSFGPTNKYKKELCSFCVCLQILHVHFNYYSQWNTSKYSTHTQTQTQFEGRHENTYRLHFFSSTLFYTNSKTMMNTTVNLLVHV